MVLRLTLIHRESLSKAFSSPGIRSNTTINGSYLTSLPRAMMRSMAGFLTSNRSFYLARSALDPPTSLCKRLFPAIDEWHDRLAAKELSPVDNDSIQPTVAANAFVQLITMLRKTFIQDSVLLMELRPCQPIRQHSFFSDPANLSFKSQTSIIELESSSMLTGICTIQTPISLQELFFCPS